MAENIRRALEGIKSLLLVVAGWTPTQIDDQLAKLIDAVLANDELINWLADLIEGDQATSAELLAIAPVAALRKVAQQAGIDWGQLLGVLLPLLLRLLERWLGELGDPVDPGNPPPGTQYQPNTQPRC